MSHFLRQFDFRFAADKSYTFLSAIFLAQDKGIKPKLRYMKFPVQNICKKSIFYIILMSSFCTLYAHSIDRKIECVSPDLTLNLQCEGNPTSFPGASDGSCTYTITGVTSPLTIEVGLSTGFVSTDGTYSLGGLDEGVHTLTAREGSTVVASCEFTVEEGEIDTCEDPLGLAGDNKIICPGETTTIGCDPVEGYCYTWSPSEGLNNPSSSMPEASPTTTTTYSLIITNDEGDLVAENLEATVSVTDGSDPNEIRTFFEALGFEPIAINIIGPSFQTNQSNNFTNNSCSQVFDAANLLIEFIDAEYSDIPINIGEEYANNCPESASILITKNENFCDLILPSVELFQACEGFVVWYHIFDMSLIAPDSPDLLFIYHNEQICQLQNDNMGDIRTFGEECNSIFSTPPNTIVPTNDHIFSVTQRAFGPWDDFGHFQLFPGAGIISENSFQGDSRGFSLAEHKIGENPDLTKVTSRIFHKASFNLTQDGLQGPDERLSSGTKGRRHMCIPVHAEECYGMLDFCNWDDPEMCEETSTVYGGASFSDNFLTMRARAKDECVWYSTDIDMRTKFKFAIEEASGNRYLIVKGIALNKKFPSSEIFIQDNYGNKVFLYAFGPEGEDEIIWEGLFFPDYDEYGIVNLRIKIDENGQFLDEVIYRTSNNSIDSGFGFGATWFPNVALIDCEGLATAEPQSISIDDWNISHLIQYPALDCQEIPCCGNLGCCEN